jgi:exopolyphosphatase/pppGpp-phosphohydrolase
MATERLTDEILDKLANFGQQTDNRIDRLVELFSEMRSNQVILQQEQTQILSNQAILQQEQVQMRHEFNHMIGIIAIQQNEIAGMQTKNRRILDILLNQRGTSDQA